jgi:hypothetical protein
MELRPERLEQRDGIDGRNGIWRRGACMTEWAMSRRDDGWNCNWKRNRRRTSAKARAGKYSSVRFTWVGGHAGDARPKWTSDEAKYFLPHGEDTDDAAYK